MSFNRRPSFLVLHSLHLMLEGWAILLSKFINKLMGHRKIFTTPLGYYSEAEGETKYFPNHCVIFEGTVQQKNGAWIDGMKS